MTYPQLSNIEFDSIEDRLKVVMPLQRKRPYLAVYSVLLATWIGATIWMLILLFGASTRGLSTQFIVIWVIILLIWAYVWYRLGRSVWRWWQYYMARREVLYIDKEILIIRRPLSLLGVTDAYDMQHVSPFYYQDEHRAVAFNYGSRGGLFGEAIPRDEAGELIAFLNRRFFPGAGDPDDY